MIKSDALGAYGQSTPPTVPTLARRFLTRVAPDTSACQALTLIAEVAASAGADGGQERNQDGDRGEGDMRAHGQDGRAPGSRLIILAWNPWRSAGGGLGGGNALRRAGGGSEKDQRHPQADHGQQQRAGGPGHAGHVRGQVA